MSFILDALKKSESDRQRQSGPALFEAQIAPPRPRLPLWSIVVAALLGMNALIFGGWLVVRSAHPGTVAAATAVPATGAVTATPALPAPSGVPAAGASVASAVESNSVTRRPSAPRDPELAALDAAPDAAEPGTAVTPDDAPAIAPPSAPRDIAPGVRIQGTSLPTRDELHSPAVAALPELRLDLHVYDPIPTKRFVLINMHRLREGESLPEGVRVEHITADGAELEYQGQRFLLPRE